MSFQRSRLSTVGFLLILPCLAAASTIQIIGTPLTGIGQTSGSGSQPVTIIDGVTNDDYFDVTWSYSASWTNTGTHVSVTPTVIYTGPGTLDSNDVITFEYLQVFTAPDGYNWDGYYTEVIPLTLSASGSGSMLSGELSYSGTGLGLVSVGPGQSTVGQNGGNVSGTNNNLTAQFLFTFNFNNGTDPGAFGTAATVPEPSQALPLGLVFLGGIWQLAVRRRRTL